MGRLGGLSRRSRSVRSEQPTATFGNKVLQNLPDAMECVNSTNDLWSQFSSSQQTSWSDVLKSVMSGYPSCRTLVDKALGRSGEGTPTLPGGAVEAPTPAGAPPAGEEPPAVTEPLLGWEVGAALGAAIVGIFL